MAKGRKRTKRKQSEPRFVRPTDQQMAHSAYESAGAAVRRMDPLLSLKRAQRLTDGQLGALHRYRDVADKAERSPIKSNMDFSVSGGGEGLPHFGVRMNWELDYMNAALGPLQPVAHAICVEGISPSTYAMRIDRAVEYIRNGIVSHEPRRKVLDAVFLDIALAGDRLLDALDKKFGSRYRNG